MITVWLDAASERFIFNALFSSGTVVHGAEKNTQDFARKVSKSSRLDFIYEYLIIKTEY